MRKTITEFPKTLIQPLVAAADAMDFIECCGFVMQSHGGAWSIRQLDNYAEEPDREFVISWRDWIKARIAPGFSIRGIYHSHPQGPRFLSRQDKEIQKMTQLDMILIDCLHQEIRWYRHTKGGPRVTATAIF